MLRNYVCENIIHYSFDFSTKSFEEFPSIIIKRCTC